MTAGLSIRITILILLVVQAVITAVLGFTELLPIEWKVVMVAASAGVGVALNQVTSWTSAPAVDRAAQRANPPAD